MALPKQLAPLPDPTRPPTKPYSLVKLGHAAVTAAALGTTGYLAMPTPAPEQVQAAPQATPKAKDDSYEIALKEAWEIEQGAGTAAWLKRLIYLYKRSAENAKTATTFTDLQKSFAAQETKLDMKGRLPFVREVVLNRWIKAFGKSPDNITENDRKAIVFLMQETVSILDRLGKLN